MRKNKGILKRIVGTASLLSLVLGISTVPVSALAEKSYAENDTASEYQRTSVISEAERSVSVKRELGLDGISNKSLWSYKSLPIYYGSKSLNINARLINGLYYIPVRSFVSKTTSYKVNYYSASKTLVVNGTGMYMSMSDGSYTVYANDRALFEASPARIMSDGAMYIPAKTIAKAFGLSISESGNKLVFSGSVSPIKSGAQYYDADTVYWLSRIISAESRGEPLFGQIAVGNVILNRVKSKDFPNTVWGVIFDRKYGVQFSPVSNGTIYNTPNYNSILAAKIVLEGFSISDEILYFIAPRYIETSWIYQNRTYRFTIKNHEFYS